MIARILRTRSRRQRRACQSTLVCAWRQKRTQAAAARIVQGRWRRCEDRTPSTTSRELQTRRGMLKILEQCSKHSFEQSWSAHRTILDSAINTSSLTRYLAVLKSAAASLLKVDLHSHISAKPLKEALKAKSTTIKHFLNFDANFTNHFLLLLRCLKIRKLMLFLLWFSQKAVFALLLIFAGISESARKPTYLWNFFVLRSSLIPFF